MCYLKITGSLTVTTMKTIKQDTYWMEKFLETSCLDNGAPALIFLPEFSMCRVD